MADILKTRGIILRTYPFKESSLFCSIFSENFGKLSLLAKGARRPKSKLCGTLEPFNHSEIIFYKREFKETHTLSDAVIIEDFENLRSSPLKVAGCESVCEFIDKTQMLEEPHSGIYMLILPFFRKLCQAEEDLTGLWTLLTLFRLLKIAGFEPHLRDCVICHTELITDSLLNFSISKGGLVCETHFDESVIKLNRQDMAPVLDVQKNPFPGKTQIDTCRKLKHLFEAFIYYHLNGLNLSSLRFI